MSYLYHALSEDDIFEQVAALINSYNSLARKRIATDLRNSKVDYIVETHGNQVIASCGIEKLNYQITEIKHLVVDPAWRGKSLGRFMVSNTVKRVSTPLIYATIREDNLPSLAVFKGCGFVETSRYFNQDHTVVMLSRGNPKWAPKPDWKSVSSGSVKRPENKELSTPPS